MAHKNKAIHDRAYYEAHKEKVLAGHKRWRTENPEKNKESIRNSKLKYLYGITLDDYNRMFQEQDGCCKICTKHQSEIAQTLHVDHCHTTGKVRGLLCGNCNRAIGLLNEDHDLFFKASKYLRTSNGG